MILFGFCVFFRYGSNVLDGQERISSGVDECDEAGAGDEVDRAGGYGGIVGIENRLPLVVESLDFRGLYLFDDGFRHVLLFGGMKVEADKDESSTYAVMLASDVPQRCLTPAACSGRMEF
ncbi:hypothetical protein ACFX19_004659 [Malus domestica]